MAKTLAPYVEGKAVTRDMLYADRKRGKGRPKRSSARTTYYRVLHRMEALYGPRLLEVFREKGYLYMPKKGLPPKKEKKFVKKVLPNGEIGEVEVVDPSREVINDTAYDVLRNIVNALNEGKIVEGFALLPEAKAKLNPSVKEVLVEKFPSGDKAYGYSLCSLK